MDSVDKNADVKFYYAKISYHDSYMPFGKYSEQEYWSSRNDRDHTLAGFLESCGFGRPAMQKGGLDYHIIDHKEFATYDELFDFKTNRGKYAEKEKSNLEKLKELKEKMDREDTDGPGDGFQLES